MTERSKALSDALRKMGNPYASLDAVEIKTPGVQVRKENREGFFDEWVITRHLNIFDRFGTLLGMFRVQEDSVPSELLQEIVPQLMVKEPKHPDEVLFLEEIDK